MISSQADIEIINPFLRQLIHFTVLCQVDFVFLQHGIIRSDLSSWLNKYNRNIKLFVTSSQAEYNSILNQPYYYDRSRVVLTGLPRFDALTSSPEGVLMVAPTYRKYLLASPTNLLGERRYNPAFKSSQYYRFYSRLIQDEQINQTLHRLGMKGEFYLHPAFATQVADFQPGESFEVMTLPYDYSSAFKRSDALVTDYSSLVFDFAYLRKPLLYAQFDKELFLYRTRKTYQRNIQR